MFPKACVFLCLCLSLALPVAAQVDQASLNGTVTDASRAVVQGAKVDVVSPTTGIRRQALTGVTGTYQVPGLPIGSYDVTVSKEGFRSAEFKNVELAVGQPRTIDAQLAVGSVSDSVEVTATLETLNRTSAEVGGLIEAEQIKEIPVSGRNWASLMLLAPGAVNYGDGSQRSIRFNGHSIDDANYTFDGIDNNGVQEQTQKAETRLNIALDSIAEFRVSTADYTAESGAAGGVQVAGGFQNRHQRIPRQHLLRDSQRRAGFPLSLRRRHHSARFTLHQFGANFGGPIKKDKAFFFANYEGLRQDLGVTAVSFVPNAAFRAQVICHLAGAESAHGRLPGRPDPPRCHHRPDQPGGQQHRARRFRHVPLRLPLQRPVHAYARYNIDDVYIDNPTDALGSHNVVPHRPTNCGSCVPAHLLAVHHQRSEVRRKSRQLPQLGLWHRARCRQRFLGLFQRPDQHTRSIPKSAPPSPTSTT